MSLQERFGNFKVTVIDYIDKRIEVDYFFSEERYNDFLKGSSCRAGMGLYDIDEVLEFNKLDDNTLVVVKNDGIETAKYKYVPIFKATMEYKEMSTESKRVNKTLTFKIRRNKFDNKTINLIDTENNSLDFNNIYGVKDYLEDKYGANKLTDWSVYVE